MFNNDDLNFDPFATDFDFNETVQSTQPQVQQATVRPQAVSQTAQAVKPVRPAKPQVQQATVRPQAVHNQSTTISSYSANVSQVQPVYNNTSTTIPQQATQTIIEGAQGTTVFGSRTNRESTSFNEPIVSKYIEWKSTLKSFCYYDSNAKQLVPVDPSTEFIPLTATLSIKGTHQVGKKGTPSLHWNNVYSNEFTNYNSDYIVVREKDSYNGTVEEIAQGTYTRDIKPVVSELPYANFTINVYCLVRGSDEVVKFMFYKSSRDVGFDISNNRMQGQCFKLDAYEEAGSAIKYNIPVLAFNRITIEEDTKATELAKEIEDKLSARNKSFLGNLKRQQPVQAVQQPVALTQDQVDYYNSGYDDFNYMG